MNKIPDKIVLDFLDWIERNFNSQKGRFYSKEELLEYSRKYMREPKNSKLWGQ